MVPSSRIARAACVAAFAFAAASGCQAGARPALRVAPAPVDVAGRGMLRLDLRAIATAWAPRRLQQARATAILGPGDTTSLRVAVRGLGMAELISEPISIVGDKLDGTALLMSLAVPAGRNRVFEVQGINPEGRVARRLRGIAAVEAGKGVTVDVDAQTDAVARVVDRLLDRADLPTPLRDALASEDLGALLTAYIAPITERLGTQNQYAGLNPVFFRGEALASALMTDGLALLSQEPDPKFYSSGASSQVVTVRDTDNLPVMGAHVAVLAPYLVAQEAAAANGEYAFERVPPGKWVVAVTYAGKNTYGELIAVDAGIPVATTIDVPTPAPVPSATAPRLLFDGASFAAGVTGAALTPASFALEPFGVGGSVDVAFTVTPAAGSAAEFQLDDPNKVDYRAYETLRFFGRGVGADAPLLVRLTHAGTPFGASYTVPAGGLPAAAWTEVKVPLVELAATPAELATADGVRFTGGSDATYRLDDIQLQGK